MKNIFIINPNAGTGRIEHMEVVIKQAADECGQDFDIYYTTEPQDATRHIRELASAAPNEQFRFFGIGGDGTVNEVANGVCGFANAVAGIIPQGTGNDFIRNFGTYDDFNDIKRQLCGHTETVDLIKTSWTIGDEIRDQYCANMINIGFDCNVVVQAAIYARKKAFNGSAAYMAGVVKMLGKMEGTDLRIEVEACDVQPDAFKTGAPYQVTDDGQCSAVTCAADAGFHLETFDGPILLTAIGNGCFCGGGVKGVPYSILTDGLMDVSIIDHMPRTSFLSLYPVYAKGTHFSKKGARERITYRKARAVTITSNMGPINLSNDGEIILFEKLRLEMVPGAMKFNVPEGC